jgi:hypothetical protein
MEIYNTDNFKDLEIHTLLGSRQISYCLNMIKSICKYDEFKDIPIILHDDGTLTDDDVKILKNKIVNCKIIRRDYADFKIINNLKEYENCKKYRLFESRTNIFYKLKLFDYFYFSDSKKILCIDTDIIFLKKPNSLIELIKNNTPFFFPDLTNAYSILLGERYFPILNRVNTGIIFIPSDIYYNIDFIEYALSKIFINSNNFSPESIEQTSYAHMMYEVGGYTELPCDKYKFPFFQEFNLSDVEAVHIVNHKPARMLYDYYVSLSKILL